jgi:hypothetical protein
MKSKKFPHNSAINPIKRMKPSICVFFYFFLPFFQVHLANGQQQLDLTIPNETRFGGFSHWIEEIRRDLEGTNPTVGFADLE